MRIVHKIEVYLPPDESFGDYAFDYKRKFGAAPVIGLNGKNMYSTWRRLGMPPILGGGDEPMYMFTLTFAGKTKIFEDNGLGDQEFSAEEPDA